MNVTQAHAAKAALLTRLNAATPAIPAVGYPVTDANFAPENIYFGTTRWTGGWRGFGATHTRDDDFELTLVVIVRRVDTPPAIEATCVTLVQQIADVIYQDTSLGGILNEAIEISGGQVAVYPATIDGAWEARADIRVHGAAVIH